MARLLDEAVQAEKDGDKAVKKSMFKWSPDWDSAVASYSAAAASFKRAKAYSDAIRVYEKAANGYTQLRVPFHAGQALDEAGTCALASDEVDAAKNLFMRAAMLYRENNTPDRAIEVLLKAAKAVEKAGNLDDACAVLGEAIQLMEDESRELFNSDAYNYYLRVLLRARKLGDARAMLERQIPKHSKRGASHEDLAYKGALSVVIIFLADDDVVGADRANQAYMADLDGYLRTPESRAAIELLDAFEAGDDAAIQKVATGNVCKFLEQEVLRLVRALGTGGKPAARQVGGGAREDPARDSLMAAAVRPTKRAGVGAAAGSAAPAAAVAPKAARVPSDSDDAPAPAPVRAGAPARAAAPVRAAAPARTAAPAHAASSDSADEPAPAPRAAAPVTRTPVAAAPVTRTPVAAAPAPRPAAAAARGASSESNDEPAALTPAAVAPASAPPRAKAPPASDSDLSFSDDKPTPTPAPAVRAVAPAAVPAPARAPAPASNRRDETDSDDIL